MLNERNPQTIWTEACEQLRGILHPDVYSRWIAVIGVHALEGENLILTVDNDFYQTWLEENYLSFIRSAVTSAAGAELTISFRVTPGSGAPAEEEPKKKPARARTKDGREKPLRPQPALNPKFTFDEFIVGPSNQFAHAATLAVAQAPSRAYNPLFIYGGVGLGKTHLMQAIGHHVLAHGHPYVCYLSTETFTNEYIDSLQNRTLVSFRKKYRTVDLLLIDDIHFLAGKERLQEEFFHTFNALSDAHKQIVMTSDRPASEIPGLEQRLVSRFEWGLVTELNPPDYETRVAILQNKLVQINATLPDEVVKFIAQNVSSNIRRLEGALIRVISYASLTGQTVELSVVERLLSDTLDQEKQGSMTFDKIQRAVAEYYDIRLADMTSKRRPQAIAFPRQVAMYLCRRLTPSSLPEIGNAFGKTHATVLHGFNTIDKRAQGDPSFRQALSSIAKKLGSSI